MLYNYIVDKEGLNKAKKTKKAKKNLFIAEMAINKGVKKINVRRNNVTQII